MNEEIAKKTNKKHVPFEKNNVLIPLKMFVIIVPFGQQPAIQKYLETCDVAATFIAAGEGTGTKDTYEVLGLSNSRKQLIFALIREDKIETLKQSLQKRFAGPLAAKGIAFSIKIRSIAGVSVYKFLTNNRMTKGAKKHGE